MKTSRAVPTESFPDGHFDPSFMPRTFPVHWDLSAMMTDSVATSSTTASTDSQPAYDCTEAADTFTDAYGELFFDTFPKPVTTPAAWNLSEIL